MFDHTNGNNSFQLNLTLYYTITSRDRKNTPQVYLNFKLKKTYKSWGIIKLWEPEFLTISSHKFLPLKAFVFCNCFSFGCFLCRFYFFLSSFCLLSCFPLFCLFSFSNILLLHYIHNIKNTLKKKKMCTNTKNVKNINRDKINCQ